MSKSLVMLDNSHEFLSKSMYAPVAWFDNFFSDDRILKEDTATSSLRLWSDLRFEEVGRTYLRTFFHAGLRLPNLNRKFKLIVAGDGEDQVDALSSDLLKTGIEQAKDNDRVNVGLRYSLLYNTVSQLHFGAGMKAEFPFKPYIRSHYHRLFPITKLSQARFSVNVIWKRLIGWSESGQFDIERLFSKSSLLRWSSSVSFDDPEVHYNWSSSIGFQYQLSVRNAISYSVSMNGYNDDSIEVSNYRTGVRFRRNFYKNWLFYEIEPANNWPRDQYGRYLPAASINFRLEAHFGYKNGKSVGSR